MGLIFFGPSEVLGFPQTFTYVMIGNCIDGIAISLIFVPLLAEIVDAVKEKEGIDEENDQLNDLASGFFSASYAIGCLVAPILGGLFNDLYGFRATCDIFAFSSLAFAGIYFFVNLLPYLIVKYQKKRQLKKGLVALPKIQEDSRTILVKSSATVDLSAQSNEAPNFAGNQLALSNN